MTATSPIVAAAENDPGQRPGRRGGVAAVTQPGRGATGRSQPSRPLPQFCRPPSPSNRSGRLLDALGPGVLAIGTSGALHFNAGSALRDFSDVSDPPQHRPPPRRARPRTTREAVAAILDAGLVAHVGISHEGAPVVIPMAYARIGDTLYLHGSTASRMMRNLKTGDPMCITVTVVDGIVLARSAFNMSMNYRAVVVQGAARLVTDDAERMTAFRAIMDHFVPGHWEHVRPPNDAGAAPDARGRRGAGRGVGQGERRPARGRARRPRAARSGPGEIPLRTVAGTPVPDAHVQAGVEPPDSVA